MANDTDRRVDEVRDQLRALGYLDARLDRFVLRGGRPAGVAGASARIGVFAGALLGPAAAIGVGLRLPGLMTGVTDALVLAVYLGLAFGVAATGVAAVGIAAGSLAARRAGQSADPARAGRWAAIAGLAVAATCLVYLVLWWRAAAAALPVGVTAGMLVVAVAISLLLGHAVTVTVLGWIATESGRAAALPVGLPLSSRRTLVTMGLGALVGAVGLLVLTSPRAVGDAPPLVVVPTGERVLVLAIDGVDLATVRRLHADGRLPRLGPLLTGAAAPIASAPNRDPARVWTTIGTGQPAERHGIAGLETRQVAGVEGRFRPGSALWRTIVAATDLLRLTRPAIASGSQRQVPTFWEVAARAGLRTAVVHWWATWPAGEDAGIVLTDRALLRLQQGGEPNGEIAPAALHDTLRASWDARRRRVTARADAMWPTRDDLAPDEAAVIQRSAELDATLIDLAADPVLGPLDLLVVYLPGLDIAQHALLGADDAGAIAPSAASARLASLERYYEFLDDALANLLIGGDSAARASLVVAVTQPGRVSAPADGLLAISGAAASGPDAIARPPATPLTPEQVAPTILFALGVPLADDLAASPAYPLLADPFVSAHPATSVPTYGTTRPRQARQGRPLDAEMIERMRSLGYVR